MAKSSGARGGIYRAPKAVKMTEPYHKPHLQNFFDAVRGRAKLSCPADSAYKTTVAALKVNEAAQKGGTLVLKSDDFVV